MRAGHNPPMLYRPLTDKIFYLKGGGIALGVVSEIALEAKNLSCSKGTYCCYLQTELLRR